MTHPRFPTRLSRVIYRFGVSVLLCCTIAACSSTSFIYNRLDTLIAWYLDDYIDFEPGQRAAFDQAIDDFLLWHRTHELPQYAAFLARVDRLLESSVSEEDLEALELIVDQFAGQLRDRALPDMLAYGAKLSPSQRQEFVERLQRQHTELAEERTSRSEVTYRADLKAQLIDNFEDYLGRLNAEQRRLIAETVPLFVRLDALWLADRGRWLARLAAIMQADEDNWSDQVMAHALAYPELRSDAYVEGLAHNLAHVRHLLVAIINSRTARQDSRLRRKLTDYRNSFEQLAATVQPDTSRASVE